MAHKKTPIPADIVDEVYANSGLTDLSIASIREVGKMVATIEARSGQRFVHMEMGVPGLPPAAVGVEAEIASLKKGVASLYPNIEGIPEVKKEASRFVKKMLNVDVSPQGCVPTVGSMQGSMAAFMTVGFRDKKKDTILFIDPGFPVQKQQLRLLGIPFCTFDVYNFRGDKLQAKLESYLSKGNIAAIVYSSPNNPSWICFTDKELKIIGEMANKYDTVIIEDLAYFAMDFRKDYGVPGEAPYQPSVANYTDQFVLMISASKIFSYAGQRIAFLAISDALYHRHFPDLASRFSSDEFGHYLVYGALYGMTSGTSHSAQYALAAMLKAVNDGLYNFRNDIIEYGEKAKIMKDLFVKYGFNIVYDKDEDLPLADGFYFTIAYPGMQSGELLKELLYYGISAVSLNITGSEHTEGLRACVSFVGRDQFDALEDRLKQFRFNNTL
ncbi:MAG: pyridoxal phosphate-dependent aminotransferase [Bacteroidales bacterium]|nr:pyridoxal phosphate-dependent aminotransferase [Bacteroidales bacterium]